MKTTTSVLIVGGSLNGLTLALLLSRRGVDCVVVERHPRTSIQYKFRGISPRSMEIYRAAGIEDEIRARDLIDDRAASVARTKNLRDGEVSWQGIPWSNSEDVSPTSAATCDQDQLEPILRAHAERHGADVCFNTELVAFSEQREHVAARVRDRATGVERVVEARYLIAADGTQSSVREVLGIARHGPGVLQHWMNVIFEAGLPAEIGGRQLRSVFVTDINGTLVPRGDGRWLMAVQYVPDNGEKAEDFTPARCAELIRRGAGQPDLGVDIVDVRPWDAAAAVADRFSSGRVFLIGDSAHVMPPTGGFGGNTGIQDGYNLAWKLDAVVRGVAGPSLLDTYDAERRPVADRTMAQALARLQAWFKDPSRKLPDPEAIVPDDAVMFGYCYPHGAFVAEPGGSAAFFEDPRQPGARAGARAPQLVVQRDARRWSTIDLSAGKWTLLHGPDGAAWRDHLSRSRLASVIGVEPVGIAPAGEWRDVNQRWPATYHLAENGAALVRPDGFIAWRAESARGQAAAALDDALDRILALREASRATALPAHRRS